MSITRTEVEQYIRYLDNQAKLFDSKDGSILVNLWKQLNEAHSLTIHDTLSDEFQITSEMINIVWKYAQRKHDWDNMLICGECGERTLEVHNHKS